MTEPSTCPRCGAPIPSGSAPGGLCPRCLFQAGLESKGSAADVIHTGAGEPRRPPPSREELAPHFPQLEIGELLGQGGMGAVYRARQKGLDRDVALKVLTVDAGADPSFAERFGREAKTLASLTHPSIVHVYDFGRAGPWYYLVMEVVDGANLRQMLRAKTVSPREALSIVAQLCDALQYAHDEGVVHRDIKPENVLVGRKGQVKVLDFGLAKLLRRGGPDPLTKTQQVMGTPYYMAPEQWERPLEVDHRADIYSLGVVFYELLTGELPVGRFALPSRKVEVDVRLDEVVVKTLEKEPELRYQHASEVKTEVDRIASGPPVLTHAAAAAPPAGRGRIWPWVAIAAGVLLFFGLLVLGALVVLDRRYETASAAAGSFEPIVPPPPAPAPAPRIGSAIPEGAWHLDEATAESIGIPSGDLARVNQILASAQRGYRALDANRARVEEIAPGSVVAELGALGPDAQALRGTLLRDLAPILGDEQKCGQVLQLLDWKEDQSRRIEIQKVPAGWRVLERPADAEQPRIERVWKTLPQEYQRLIDRARRPGTPVPAPAAPAAPEPQPN